MVPAQFSLSKPVSPRVDDSFHQLSINEISRPRCPMTGTVERVVGEVGPENKSLLDEDEIGPGKPNGTDLEAEEVDAETGKEARLDEDGIPLELQGRQFRDIDELHDEVEALGLTDYKFLLDSSGFVNIPDPERNSGSDFILQELAEYCKGWLGVWGWAKCKNVQEVNRLTATGRQAKREPDVGFWNYQKCSKVGKKIKVKKRGGSRFELDPDVLFQCSWGNTEAREFAAMNDIMTLGGMGVGNAGPRVGLLVKVRKVGGNDVGIDVYKVYNGRTVADAIAQTHNCTHTYYNHAAGNDVTIEIPAVDFGFTSIWQSLLFPSFRLSLRELWEFVKLG